MPTVPVTVWEQIPVIVIFSFLLLAGAALMVKAFTKAVADINNHYAKIVESNNEQWQKYFDARSDSNAVVSGQLVDKLERLTGIIDKLVSDFEKHDAVEISLLQQMAQKQIANKQAAKKPARTHKGKLNPN